jgi:hypothetical protein
MNRYYFDEADMLTGDQNYDSSFLRFGIGKTDQPRRSPIRRKDKLRQPMGMKPKAKRNFKKIQNKIKYDWEGE